jgi:glc operon protein GlcG
MRNRGLFSCWGVQMRQHATWVDLVGVIAASVLAAAANAQPASAEFVVSGAAAERILDSTTINLATAERLTMACERLAEQEGVQISVYVIDHGGNHVYVHRMDGQRWTNIATAEMKARTALQLRGPSKERMNHVIRDPSDEARQIELGLFPNSGGLPIVVNDQLIGAIGIGGSRPRVDEGWSDEICAHKALTEALGPQPPLLEDLPRPPSGVNVPVPRFAAASPPASTLPAEFVVSGAAAARIFDGTQISGDAARRVALACREWASSRGRTMSLFILDAAGNPVHGERMDGQLPIEIKTALLKAQTSQRSREATSAQSAGLQNNPAGLPRSVLLFDFYAVPGGLPIVVDGQMIGAIGVSGIGGDDDEACAVAGLEAVFGEHALIPVVASSR